MPSQLKKEPRPFAVFDIDGTLIRWQLFHAIVHHLGKRGMLPADTHEAIRNARMVWKTRGSSDGFRTYERILVEAYINALTSITPSLYNEIVVEVFEEYKDQVFVYTRDLMRSLKKQGYVLFAISGSQDEIVKLLAKYHGFDDAMGAQLEQKDNAFTGIIASPIFNKKEALQQLVDNHNVTFNRSYAIGDSESDVPMLKMVEFPIVFNPDKTLLAIAKKKGWNVVVERKNIAYELNYVDGTYQLSQ